MSARWHDIAHAPVGVTHCRHLPPRFDFAVQTVLPRGRPRRLAHQIRQDLWRALRRVRGFSPVIRLEPVPDGWLVTAGGRLTGRLAAADMARATTVLTDSRNRLRWMRHAGNSS